jgi:peptidoglycan/LPS O-acetylase OafA/YrhL
MAKAATSSQIGAPPISRGGWLDALRLIVACLMVVHHFQKAAPVPLEALHPVFERGYLLTNFFLIDSGYVLARIYGAQVADGRMGLGAFFRKRLLRLVPAHLFMSTVLVGLVLLAQAVGFDPRHPEWFDWSQLPAQVLLVQAYGVPGGLGWNAPTWSISALLGCYLVFPAVLRGVRRLSGWQALVLGVALYLAADALAQRFLGFPVYQMPMRYGFFRALPLFVGGVLLARASETLTIAPRAAAALGFGSAAALALLQAVGPFSLISLALVCVIILAAAAAPVARPSRFIERGALAAFAIFITNEVVRIGWFGVVNVAAARLGWTAEIQWAVWACGLAAAVGFGFVFYALVDRPTQAVLNRLRAPRPAGIDLDRFGRSPAFIEVPIRKLGFRAA